MRPPRPLVLGGLFVAAVAGLTLLRPDGEPAEEVAKGAGPPAPAEPLVALPWDEVEARRIGGVSVDVPRRWEAGGGPKLVPLRFTGSPEAGLRERLSADCARPVVLRWKEQWRGECRTRGGERVRGAVIRLSGEWRGVEARYPDGADRRLAPRVARMLASLAE